MENWLYSRFVSTEATEALEYAIRLMRKDIAIDPGVTKEKLEQLDILCKLLEAFKKRQEIVIL